MFFSYEQSLVGCTHVAFKKELRRFHALSLVKFHKFFAFYCVGGFDPVQAMNQGEKRLGRNHRYMIAPAWEPVSHCNQRLTCGGACVRLCEVVQPSASIKLGTQTASQRRVRNAGTAGRRNHRDCDRISGCIESRRVAQIVSACKRTDFRRRRTHQRRIGQCNGGARSITDNRLVAIGVKTCPTSAPTGNYCVDWG